MSPSSNGNWTYTPTSACASTTTTESTSFVNGPGTPPMGYGSLQMNVGSNGDSSPRWYLTGWSGTRLDALTSLGYSTYVQQYIDSQAIYLRLYLDLDGDNVVDDSIFFEPVYQSSTYMPSNPQGPLTTGTWQTWDALNGGWWSNNSLASATPGSGVKTLAQYLAVYPNARIMDATNGGVSLQAGCGAGSWDNFIGNVDALTIGTSAGSTTYDFEPNTALVTGTKSVSGTFAPGYQVTYTVTLTNEGAATQLDNTGDEFVDTLPSQLALNSATASSGSATTGGNTAHWNGTLAGGASVTITIVATILPGTEGQTVSNQGTINYDPNGSGTNSASGQTTGPGPNGTTTFVVIPAVAVPALSWPALLLLAGALAIAGALILRR